jgi:hypothetical protein
MAGEVLINGLLESMLSEVSESLVDHGNRYTALIVHEAVRQVLQGVAQKGLLGRVQLAAWDDEDEIEVVVDLGVRRLQLKAFCEGETNHRVRFSEITSDHVTRFPAGLRPFGVSRHIEWLIGQ